MPRCLPSGSYAMTHHLGPCLWSLNLATDVLPLLQLTACPGSVDTFPPGHFGYPSREIFTMKFDPCGGAAVMAERSSETLGTISFRLHQVQYDKRSKRA